MNENQKNIAENQNFVRENFSSHHFNIFSCAINSNYQCDKLHLPMQ